LGSGHWALVSGQWALVSGQWSLGSGDLSHGSGDKKQALPGFLWDSGVHEQVCRDLAHLPRPLSRQGDGAGIASAFPTEMLEGPKIPIRRSSLRNRSAADSSGFPHAIAVNGMTVTNDH
jgi:hypothetical protein